jgi:hypothetical protein
MSVRSATLGIRDTAPGALRTARAALAERGWDVDARDDGLTAREDPCRLPCHSWPSEVQVEVARSEDLGTLLNVEVEVPGWGPISARHAREQLAALARAIAGPEPGSQSPSG